MLLINTLHSLNVKRKVMINFKVSSKTHLKMGKMFPEQNKVAD